jgi:ankyrin repeat protein
MSLYGPGIKVSSIRRAVARPVRTLCLGLAAFFIALDSTQGRQLTPQEVATLTAWSGGGFGNNDAAARLAARLGAEVELDAEKILLDTHNDRGLEAFVGSLASGHEQDPIDINAVSKRVLEPEMAPGLKARVSVLLERQMGNVRRAQEYTAANLAWWIMSRRSDLVGKFLDHDFDLNGAGINGATPLAAALTTGQTDIVRRLLERGADARMPSGPLRITPLDMACLTDPAGQSHASAERVALLVAHGASMDEPDALGRRPVHFAAMSGNAECLARIVSLGGRVGDKTAGAKQLNTQDVRTLDYAGATPLHYAVAAPTVDSAAFLLSHGANVDAKTEKGFTPIFFAVESRARPEMLELLMRHGADVNVSVDGVTPRLIARVSQAIETEKILADAGGTYNPLMLAKAKIQLFMFGSGH